MVFVFFLPWLISIKIKYDEISDLNLLEIEF